MQDNATLLGTTDPGAQITKYSFMVKDLIRNIRPYIPQHKVWVQVSVNPPSNRYITAQRVIEYINSVADGTSDSPDEIQIFYKYTDYPGQIPVLKQVIEHYRPLPVVCVDAVFYLDVKNQLLSGDTVAMPAIRQSADLPMTADHWKFKKAVTNLNAVPKDEIGVKKEILFSAVDDVRNLIGSIPDDIDLVSYNMESWMTPASDFQDVSLSVKEFADIVHIAGRKMGFAPTRRDYDPLEQSGQLVAILQSVDVIMYQGQNLLPAIGEDAFVQTMQQKYSYVKKTNPNVQFDLQLWLNGVQTPDQMISAFNRIKNFMDIAGIGTHNIDNRTDVQQVLSGLTWRQSAPSDTTPPATAIVTDDGNYTNNSTILNASWSSSDPESGIAEYQYAIGTAQGVTDIVNWTSAGENTSVSKTGLALTSGTTYYFAVKAKNGAGLFSNEGYSDGITVDIMPPSVSITEPVDNATVTGSINVSAIASDDVGVVGVQFKLDGVDLGIEDAFAPYVVSFDTTTIAYGPHTFSVTARDASQQQTTVSVTVNVNNDAVPPTIPGAPYLLSGDNPNNTGTYIITWVPSTDNIGGSGIEGYDVYRNDLKVAHLTTNSYSESNLSNGRYTYTCKAIDNAGNTSGLSPQSQKIIVRIKK